MSSKDSSQSFLDPFTKSIALKAWPHVCRQARVFQNSRCALSGSALELPAVHFMCGHSFNARALGDNERECPLCAPQFHTILDIRRSLRAGASEQVRNFLFSRLRN